METTQKWIWYVIQWFILLLVISAGVTVWVLTRPIMDATKEQAATQERMISEAQFSPYDGQTVSGSAVVTAMRRYSNKPNFFIYVQKIGPNLNFAASPSGVSSVCQSVNYTTAELITGTTTCNVFESHMTDQTSQYYIPVQAVFRATLLRDRNDRIAGIFFRMK